MWGGAGGNGAARLPQACNHPAVVGPRHWPTRLDREDACFSRAVENSGKMARLMELVEDRPISWGRGGCGTASGRADLVFLRGKSASFSKLAIDCGAMCRRCDGLALYDYMIGYSPRGRRRNTRNILEPSRSWLEGEASVGRRPHVRGC